MNGRRDRLRQAALAWAGLGSLVLLNTFFAELGLRSQADQAKELGLGALFVLTSAVLLGLDIRIGGRAWSVWLARLLLVPGLWRMFALLRVGLAVQGAVVGEGNWPHLAQAAALINVALMSIVLVLLARAGFGGDAPAVGSQSLPMGPQTEGCEAER